MEKLMLGWVSNMSTVTQLVSGGTEPALRPDSRIPTLPSLGHKLTDSQRIRPCKLLLALVRN